MKHGARNDLAGTVTKVTKGKVMCLVKVRVPKPAEISSVLTLESLRALGLKKGSRVRAIVKAVSVLLVRD